MAQQVKSDRILFGVILGLVVGGLLVVASASFFTAQVKHGAGGYFAMRQLIWALAAVAAMMLFKSRDYRRFNTSPWAYGAMAVILLLLMLVYFLDPRTHRWFRIGPVSIQPSEFAKPVLILFLAHFAAGRAAVINSRRTLLCAAVIVGAVAGMVMVGDLGTAVVITAAAAAVFLVAGLEWRFTAIAGASMAVFVLVAIFSTPYRIARFFGYVDPEYKLLDTALVRQLDPDGSWKAWLRRNAPAGDSGYQLDQSLTAVGSGGPLGVGPTRSQMKLRHLPEAHTDFIYAILAEELGLWGALVFAGAFLVIFWRGMRIHFRAPDDFGRFVALGVTFMVAVQAFMNISVVLGILPTKGIPLPLVSYGGSSLLSTMMSLGILQSVGEHSG